jgi:LysM repeat protein
MKRLLSSALIATMLVSPATALAQSLEPNHDINALFGFELPIIKELVKKPTPKPLPEPPKPVVYVVAAGDNLSKIGEANNVDWQRLWAKNTQLTNPDVLNVGDQLTIPSPDEELARELPYVVSLPTYTTSVTATPHRASPQATGDLTGSYGYALPYGNCVNEPGVNNPGYGNPISWPITSTNPWIGATFLFYSNHTGVVTGIWSNGDIEVRHQNYYGGTHRFPRSMFRGFR